MQSKTDNYYINGIHDRDHHILQEIYRRFLPAVISFVIRNGGQTEDGKDIFNLVIYQLTARLNQEKIYISSTFEAYLFTACKNMWRRKLKKDQRERVTIDTVRELYYTEQDLVQSTLEQEKWDLFTEKLDEISENCKKVLKMFFNKMSSKVIMKEMNYSSEATVRQRIFKCKAQLTKLIHKDYRYNELKDL